MPLGFETNEKLKKEVGGRKSQIKTEKMMKMMKSSYTKLIKINPNQMMIIKFYAKQIDPIISRYRTFHFSLSSTKF